MRSIIICLSLLVSCGTLPLDAQWHSSYQKRQQWKRRSAPTVPVPAPKPPVTEPTPPPPPPTPTPSPALSVAEQIAGDMGINEGPPHGVPDYWDFYSRSYVERGNNPDGDRAAVQWGVIYVDENGSSATNTRINIKSCEIYWLQRSTGSWITGTKTSTPLIESYAENFDGPTTAADVRNEPDGTVSTVTRAGRNVHFYPRQRFTILPNDLAGWVGVCQMRLIKGNPSGPDDRAQAHFLGETGADYYPGLDSPGINRNPAIAGGRYKYVRNEWRSFGMTTLPRDVLERNPPPVNLTGALP
jgi:hypothetical protein